jgi:hypothetical protein
MSLGQNLVGCIVFGPKRDEVTGVEKTTRT